jgi:hypothetical protein
MRSRARPEEPRERLVLRVRVEAELREEADAVDRRADPLELVDRLDELLRGQRRDAAGVPAAERLRALEGGVRVLLERGVVDAGVERRESPTRPGRRSALT